MTTNGADIQEAFKILREAGVFDLQHGKVTINMHEGHIQSIVIERRTYQHVAVVQRAGSVRALP